MQGNEIRSRFLKFFADKGHKIVPSFSLIPEDDPSLLLIGAGMAPLKPYFTGAKKPPAPRMANCQKCVRTGDIEMVGQTARHHTFFEMLGNFSFGNYFKKEAITWAWEFLRQELKIDADKLWVSVYHEDQQAWDIWHEDIGLSPERIVRLGKEDNFWEIGVGPCGPCSEIYVDMGEELGCGQADCKPGCDCDRFLEIWNLVFTQFDKDEDGNYNPLPTPNIDTGMGLERLAAVLQGVSTNYDCDLILPLIQQFAKIAGVDYGDERYTRSLRVIADHFRAVAFMLADGILPANEGRGYVLRRLLRRAVRHGMICGVKGSFLHQGVDLLVDMFGSVYPDLVDNRQMLVATIKAEEERFLATISQGLDLLQVELDKVGEGGVLAGPTVFRLYDTFGFPLELTVEIADEAKVQVDEEGFQQALEVQRNKARAAREDTDAMGGDSLAPLVQQFPATQFTGYTSPSGTGKVIGLVSQQQPIQQAESGDRVFVILDKTPFYAEGGGQVADTGSLHGSNAMLRVDNVQSVDGVFLHRCQVERGSIAVGDNITGEVSPRRRDIEANHTATHLVHKVLRQVLGDHVRQAGSLVDAERLRFDFTHGQPLTAEEIELVEQRVNALVAADLPVDGCEMSREQAQQQGAVALFGEKYGDSVRVVSVGDVSRELCGGTHVATTARVRGFKILAETGIGAGVRRLEAVTGDAMLRHLWEVERTLADTAAALKAKPDQVLARAQELVEQVREYRQNNEKLQAQLIALESGDLVQHAQEVQGVKVLAQQVQAPDMAGLRSQVEQLRDKLGTGVVVLGSVSQDKVNMAAAVSKDLVQQGVHAGRIIGSVAKMVGGGGGGRPDMAQAGGKNPQQLEQALGQVVQLVEQQLVGK